QDAVAALARKIDALDAVSRRKRGNEAREAIRLAENAFAIAEHGKIERDRDAVEIRRIELAAGGKGRRDDRVANGETAEAFDHEGEAGALWSPERQQRRELPGVGGVASLRVQPPAERNVARHRARSSPFPWRHSTWTCRATAAAGSWPGTRSPADCLRRRRPW